MTRSIPGGSDSARWARCPRRSLWRSTWRRPASRPNRTGSLRSAPCDLTPQARSSASSSGWSTRSDPPARARAVHGISDAELARADTAEVVLPEFLTFLGNPDRTTLLAHNATFDAGFLGRELARLGRPMPGHVVVDTLALSRKRWPKLGSHKLDFLARSLDLDPHGPHRALADSRRVRGLWLALIQKPEAGELPLAYPIFDARCPLPAPRGWGQVEEAIGRDQILRIEYTGGTRGLAARDVTPRRFSNRGGRGVPGRDLPHRPQRKGVPARSRPELCRRRPSTHRSPDRWRACW